MKLMKTALKVMYINLEAIEACWLDRQRNSLLKTVTVFYERALGTWRRWEEQQMLKKKRSLSDCQSHHCSTGNLNVIFAG